MRVRMRGAGYAAWSVVVAVVAWGAPLLLAGAAIGGSIEWMVRR